MHIQSINTEVVSCQADAGENLGQCQMHPISVKNYFIGKLLHLALDESKQVFLVHACGVMDVSVNLANVIEISVRNLLAICGFLVFVDERVKVEFAL
jgi:hypothetical protein